MWLLETSCYSKRILRLLYIHCSIFNDSILFRKKQGVLVKNDGNSWSNRVGNFWCLYGTGEKKFCIPRTTPGPLWSTKSMATTAMAVEWCLFYQLKRWTLVWFKPESPATMSWKIGTSKLDLLLHSQPVAAYYLYITPSFIVFSLTGHIATFYNCDCLPSRADCQLNILL